ncbi:BsaA family SipW-dependent biofilm matrix protein [uncultured Clostridium sp.]|uniref:BsaA family SipW-dependent biofilm matrix protein n=1 Tax=uncultured Clostridium sp. TaxID=59620 RepID=UPI0025E62D50|nr:BsaA family SipW-dependent biofilm matrix protein [uncultured Clostridium sp.]
MNKKKLAALLISGALAIGIVGGSLAWFTSTDSVENEFTTGTTEDNKPDAGIKIDETFDKDAAKKIVPGTEINKDVAVKSTANYAQFIRAKLTLKIKDENGNYVEKKLTDNYTDGVTYGDLINLKYFEDENGNLGEDGKWIQDGDYFYYMAAVPGAGTTSKLLDSVTLNTKADNTWKNKEFEVVVDALGVQASNDAVADVFKEASADTINTLKSLQVSN